jgi:preprotein translocase subunit SecE
VSNDHDGVSEDGQQPVDATPSDEAAEKSAPGAVSEADGSDVVAADGDEPRAAPPAGESNGSDAVPPSAAALSTGTATLNTPVSAGSARAAARRSAARAGVSDTKGVATPKRAAATATKKPNIFARLGRFLREVVAELRKVIWPTKNQMVTYTIVVIVFVVFMVALVGVLDLLFAKGVLAVFG